MKLLPLIMTAWLFCTSTAWAHQQNQTPKRGVAVLHHSHKGFHAARSQYRDG